MYWSLCPSNAFYIQNEIYVLKNLYHNKNLALLESLAWNQMIKKSRIKGRKSPKRHRTKADRGLFPQRTEKLEFPTKSLHLPTHCFLKITHQPPRINCLLSVEVVFVVASNQANLLSNILPIHTSLFWPFLEMTENKGWCRTNDQSYSPRNPEWRS